MKDKEEKPSLERCFNCILKFGCQDAITGKYDPCNRWTDTKPSKLIS